MWVWRVLAIVQLLAATFVTVGAARHLHELIEHEQGKLCIESSGQVDVGHSAEYEGHCEDADHDKDSGDSVPPEQRHSGSHHCLTCHSLAALGKLTHAPPSLHAILIVAASNTLEQRTRTVLFTSFRCTLAAPRGPPSYS